MKQLANTKSTVFDVEFWFPGFCTKKAAAVQSRSEGHHPQTLSSSEVGHVIIPKQITGAK